MSERQSKRAVMVAPHAPIETVITPLPPAEPGGAVVAVEMGGVCGTDVHLWHGAVPLDGPIVLGHEGIGRLAELGDGALTDYVGEPVNVGDRVYWAPFNPCHRCYPCTILKDYSLCVRLAEGLFTHPDDPSHASYNDYAFLPAGMPFFKVPDGTPSEAIIAFGCALPTILQAIERLGYIRPGEHVVVQGSGPVGLAATLVARASGAGLIGVIGTPAHRLDAALGLGADFTIDIGDVPEQDDRIDEIRSRLPRGADVVIEAAGVLEAFTEGLPLVSRNGRYLVVGLWGGAGGVDVDPRLINNNNLTIVGSALAGPEHYYQAVGFTTTHHSRYPMADAVTHRFKIDRAQEALEAVANLETVKAVIVP